jgi:hypothetical protein
MVKRTTVLLDPLELAELFEALDLWEKIEDGRLDTTAVVSSVAPSNSWPGATSHLLKHRNLAGAHACTTHQIIDPIQGCVHWDESDIKMGEITLAKRASTV